VIAQVFLLFAIASLMLLLVSPGLRSGWLNGGNDGDADGGGDGD
jgi:hypothetical protein